MMMMGRPGNRSGARPGGAGFMGMGMPVEKSKDFRGTLRRLVARLRPERLTIAIVVMVASASVVFSVIGPKLIGNATNVIFEGVIGKSLPAGITKDQAVEALRSHGQGQLADMLSGTSVVPGAGVDFAQLAQILLLAALVYLLAAVLTVVGVLAMMLWISSLLAGIAILTIPLSLVVTVVIAGRSQKEFVAQ